MTTSYQDYLNQIDELKKKAEESRKLEIAGAIVEIKKLMAKFDLQAEDLGFKRRKGAARAKAEAKFRDPATGKTWSGRGRKPGWLGRAEKIA